MALLCYFKCVDGKYSDCKLPDPQIVRGTKLSAKKAKIGKRAAKHVVLDTIHHYVTKLPEPLKESLVHA